MHFFKKNIDLKYIAAILLVVILSVAIKTLFIFHGQWDSQFFVPYNTDETIVLNTVARYFNEHIYDATSMIGIGYLTFLYNFFFLFFISMFSILKLFGISIVSAVSRYALMAYAGRFIVVLCSVLFSFSAWAVFGRLFKNKIIKILYLVLLNFNVLYFSYSSYLKYDFIVAALGFISIYYGLKYFEAQTKQNYFKFFLFAILAAAASFYGFIYLFNLVLVTLYTQRLSFFKKKFNLILLISAPLIFGLLNWQYIIYWRDILKLNPLFLNGSFGNAVPFLTNLNGLNSGYWYLLYLKDLFGLVIFLLMAIGIYLCAKAKILNTYYKILLTSFLIYFIYLSFVAYRTDRLIMPFIVIVLFFALFVFDYLIENFLKRRSFKIIALIILLLAFVAPIICKTYIYAESLVQEDTRYILYQWLQNNLHEGETINFLHLSISGAYSTAQKIGFNNTKKYNINIVNLDKNEKLKSKYGYVVLSEVDFLILKEYKNVYAEQYAWVEKLKNNNKIVALIDNNNFFEQPFGSSAMAPTNSLYGFHNPPFYVIKMTENIILEKEPFAQSASKNNLIADLNKWDISESSDEDLNVFKMTHGDAEINFKAEKNFEILTKNKKERLSLSYLGSDLGFGFSSQKYAGQSFTASAWIKASDPYCARIGFYRGNPSAMGWGDYNFSDEKDMYELITYKDKFDDPYTLNGNLFFEIEPNCKVEIANPVMIMD